MVLVIGVMNSASKLESVCHLLLLMDSMCSEGLDMYRKKITLN